MPAAPQGARTSLRVTASIASDSPRHQADIAQACCGTGMPASMITPANARPKRG